MNSFVNLGTVQFDGGIRPCGIEGGFTDLCLMEDEVEQEGYGEGIVFLASTSRFLNPRNFSNFSPLGLVHLILVVAVVGNVLVGEAVLACGWGL